MTIAQKLVETNEKLNRVGEDAVGVKHRIINAVSGITDASSLAEMGEDELDELIEASSRLAELKATARELGRIRKDLSRGLS